MFAAALAAHSARVEACLEALFAEQPKGKLTDAMRYATLAGGKRLRAFLVLEGAQSDSNGYYPVGSLIVNPPGSRHAVWSEEGCRVLIVWERPVRFLDSETAD